MEVHAETLRLDVPLALDCGDSLEDVEIAFETYGQLNAAADNAVLLCHGLTADQHAAGGLHPGNGRPGWWEAIIGPGKPLDTNRFYILSSNTLGSYGGSTGPASIAPLTGRPYGMAFPVITIADMVRAQRQLAQQLGIERFQAAIGGCMGGFQIFEWLRQAPGQIGHAVAISATARTSAHNTALWSVLRRAITSDPNWNNGNYYDGPRPDQGMGLMAAFGALFWMSREGLEQRFGLRRAADAPRWSLDSEFEVEQFLDRIADNAAGSIDPNALLYLTRAIDYFDLTREGDGLEEAFVNVAGPVTLVSYRGDWRYPPEEIEHIREAMINLGVDARHVIVDSEYGHGGFLK
ncbi:MAG: homoserine O-acetyltransferase MetX, partial [Alphaproteobacteria bacterium]